MLIYNDKCITLEVFLNALVLSIGRLELVYQQQKSTPIHAHQYIRARISTTTKSTPIHAHQSRPRHQKFWQMGMGLNGVGPPCLFIQIEL